MLKMDSPPPPILEPIWANLSYHWQNFPHFWQKAIFNGHSIKYWTYAYDWYVSSFYPAGEVTVTYLDLEFPQYHHIFFSRLKETGTHPPSSTYNGVLLLFTNFPSMHSRLCMLSGLWVCLLQGQSIPSCTASARSRTSGESSSVTLEDTVQLCVTAVNK